MTIDLILFFISKQQAQTASPNGKPKCQTRKSNSMMHPEKFSLRSRITSFRYAIKGILAFIRQEHNARIHVVATVAVIIAAIIFHVSYPEAAALAIVTGTVWITEILNTCLEKMADIVHPGFHPTIKFIKDLAAGAVLIAAITAVVVALFIFIPKLL
jgi:diacylglycerol kinase (ATP)